MYTPNDNGVFNAAFSGAMAGMGFAGRLPTNTNPTSYALAANAAGAYAQAVDTAIGAGSEPPLTLAVQCISTGIWLERYPKKEEAQVAATYTAEANMVLAAIEAVEIYYAANGIPGTDTALSVIKQVRTDTVGAPGFGTITQGDAAKVTNTVNITTTSGNLLIWGNLSGNGGVHNGNAVVTILVDGVQVAVNLASWVSADDVNRTIPVMANVQGLSPGAHAVTMTVVISAGAGGTTFTDSGLDDVLIVQEYANQ